MGPGQSTLLSQRGLMTFLETAAVRHAPENAWNELRVIHEAESVEDLIFSLKLRSTRVSNALRFSLIAGEVAKFGKAAVGRLRDTASTT